MSSPIKLIAFMVPILLFFAACSEDTVSERNHDSSPAQSPAATASAESETTTANDPLASFFAQVVSEVPSNVDASKAISLHDIANLDNHSDEVLLRVRIGGRADPFVNGRAVMLVTTETEQSSGCSSCGTCDLNKAPTALVQLSDEDGRPLSGDLRGRYGLTTGSTILVSGRVQKDDNGQALIHASQITPLSRS